MKLGIDLGGTKIEGALVSEDGRLVKNIRVPAKYERDALIQSIVSIIKKLDRKDVDVIGLGIPGPIDDEGLFHGFTTIDCLQDLNVAREIEKYVGKKVFQENDANCFVLAEHLIGAGRGYTNVVGVILGTGVGGGIIIDRKLYRSHGSAGEFGEMIIHAKKTFEELCGGPHIVKRYVDAGGKMNNPDPKKIFASDEFVAKKIVEDTFRYLRIGFGNIIVALNPDIIVVGGGLSNLPIYAKLNRDVRRHLPEAFNVKIVKNKLGDSSGVIGAAFLRA